MNIKELLQKDKELFESANAVVKAEWFTKYLALCRAEFMTLTDTNADILKGALQFESVVLSMTDLPEDTKGLPGTGLIHDIPEYIKQEQSKDKK